MGVSFPLVLTERSFVECSSTRHSLSVSTEPSDLIRRGSPTSGEWALSSPCPVSIQTSFEAVPMESVGFQQTTSLQVPIPAVASTKSPEQHSKPPVLAHPLISSNMSDNISAKLESGLESDRVEAVAFLAEHGSPRARQLVSEIALSAQDESPLVRSVAIVASDWTDDFSKLERLFLDYGTDAEVARAVLNAADLADIDIGQRESFNRFLIGRLHAVSDPRTVVNVLEYFRQKDQYWRDQSLDILSQFDEVPPEIQNYFDMLEDDDLRDE